MVRIQGMQYDVVEDVKDAWDEEAFKARYSEVLSKYDYIVGDWGYNQLRLKGFFEDRHKKSTHDTKISTLPDYLYEYCNFGCAYFVIKRVREEKEKQPSVES
ncbi:YutD family protein [Halalkalibacter akibai]|uniref:Hypothetical DUF1027 domain protein n=1 Tax=Halalkalibacter akibai (strain ATCC 43226 / DSM 21942 / CIP 109018 / JCM 9157 / 1139) TaxID=1236973 RepID=W4QMW9_HALA3|nr:YutD family protein [Halalkalibacter akibai]GAE33267.1 hypothetical DUF1027 domain protein [Halalkalibacter akibai JCM 9157]